MKKFRFSLETVLEYKQQILDSLQAEHGAILARIRQQEEHIEMLEAEYRHLSQEFNRRKTEGISILDALKYEQYLRAMERQIEEARQFLAELQKQEEAKRREVVEAKKDTSSLEKLREKKLDLYNKEAAKAEEQFLEEFVSTARANQTASA